MKKKTITTLFDKVFWYIVYMLPIVVMLILTLKQGDFVTIADTFTSLNLTGIDGSIVYNALFGIFGTGGIMPIFASPDILLFMSYFVYANIVHLFVDFILFIPRLAKKWMHGIAGGEE